MTPEQREKHEITNAAWREKNREHAKAYASAYRKKNREKVYAYNAAYGQTHREAINAYRRRRKAKIKFAQKSLYQTACDTVPRYLPRHIRDDVISEITLAVLEGTLAAEDIAKSAKKYLTAWNRDFGSYGTVSLDAVIPGTENLRLYDIIPSQESVHESA